MNAGACAVGRRQCLSLIVSTSRSKRTAAELARDWFVKHLEANPTPA